MGFIGSGIQGDPSVTVALAESEHLPFDGLKIIHVIIKVGALAVAEHTSLGAVFTLSCKKVETMQVYVRYVFGINLVFKTTW